MLHARAACESKLTLGLYRNSLVERSREELSGGGVEGRKTAFREASWI
jgi:hypothetical protein